MHFETRLLATGIYSVRSRTGDLISPLHLSTTYDQFQAEVPGYFYGRTENPTRDFLEQVLAGLESAHDALTYSSGQAAAAAICSLVPGGKRIVASADHYSGTHALLQTLQERGIETDWVDLTNLRLLEQVIAESPPAMIWVETPSNPFLQVADISAIAERARACGALLVVDNTIAGPALQQPLKHGADFSLYSTTKIIAGHLDAGGGAVVYQDPELGDRLRHQRDTVGGVSSPFDCYQIHRGLKTLAVRVRRQVETAETLAAILSEAPGVTQVYYPGWASQSELELTRRQMDGPGYLVSFSITGDSEALLAALQVIKPAVSLGGVHSLLEVPATMTHAQLPNSYKAEIGLTPKLLRLSAGLEHPDDLRDDLLRALAASG